MLQKEDGICHEGRKKARHEGWSGRGSEGGWGQMGGWGKDVSEKSAGKIWILKKNVYLCNPKTTVL